MYIVIIANLNFTYKSMFTQSMVLADLVHEACDA
jgi:hypothetical protein